MSKTRKAVGRPRTQYPELFMFEIKGCKPSYHLNVNLNPRETGAYGEIALMELETNCTYPEKLAGRTARFDIYGKRDFMQPEEYRLNPKWRDNCVAFLQLPPSGGSCHARIPYEYMTFIMTAISQGLIHFIYLYGSPLSRGTSFCTSMQFMQTADE